MSKYGHRPHDWFEGLVNKMGGESAAEAFLRGELTLSVPTRAWRESEGVIYLSVTSDGTTGPDWITRLEGKGFRLNQYSKSVLTSGAFKSTTGVTTEIAVLKGSFFTDDDRITSKIRSEAGKRKWQKPNAEVACLIREQFSDKEIEVMGLVWLVVMHEPIKDSGGDPGLLGANRDDDGRWLYAVYDGPDSRWNRENGFAFSVPQASAL